MSEPLGKGVVKLVLVELSVVVTLANLRFTCVLSTSRLVDMSSKLDNQLLRGSGVSDFPAPDLMSLLKI